MSLAVLTNEFSFLFSAFWHLFELLWISIFFSVSCRLCKSVKIESILMSLISQQFKPACLLLIVLICCSNWMASRLSDASCLSIGRRTLIIFTGVIILREIIEVGYIDIDDGCKCVGDKPWGEIRCLAENKGKIEVRVRLRSGCKEVPREKLLSCWRPILLLLN